MSNSFYLLKSYKNQFNINYSLKLVIKILDILKKIKSKVLEIVSGSTLIRIDMLVKIQAIEK